MDTITADVLVRAATAVARVIDREDVDVHTVRLELNGQHGGVDLKIEGVKVARGNYAIGEDYNEEVVIR